MKYYVIAGEPSGDLYAARLVHELKKLDPPAAVRGWGGDLLRAEGTELVKHYKELAFMGFIEVAMNLRTILRNISFCKEDILQFKPDALILVDYPGFNLRIAQWARQNGIRVFYYISPTVWAWHESRVKTIKQSVDRMFTIIPFEKDFFAKHDYDVAYYGHPLADIIEEAEQHMPSREDFLKKHTLPDKPIILLMPGSRNQEIHYILPEMLKVVKHFPNHQFVIGASAAFSDNFRDQVKDHDVHLVSGDTYALMHHAQAGLVKSGTSTLESALLKLPIVLCYKGNPVSVQIARWVARVKYIGMPNLILDRAAITELIQDELNEGRLVEELRAIIAGPKRNELLNAYNILRGLLHAGNVSAKIAGEMVHRLQNEKA